MPKRYSPEFRRRVLDLLKAGRSVSQVALDLQISDQVIYNWRRQDRMDTGRMPGLTSTDHQELLAAPRRIAELEIELAVHRRPNELLEETVPPKPGSRPSGRWPLIACSRSPTTCVSRSRFRFISRTRRPSRLGTTWRRSALDVVQATQCVASVVAHTTKPVAAVVSEPCIVRKPGLATLPADTR